MNKLSRLASLIVAFLTAYVSLTTDATEAELGVGLLIAIFLMLVAIEVQIREAK